VLARKFLTPFFRIPLRDAAGPQPFLAVVVGDGVQRHHQDLLPVHVIERLAAALEPDQVAGVVPGSWWSVDYAGNGKN